MPSFLLPRLRAHRLLLAAAALTVLLTTVVLTTLSAFSTAIGDAGLQHELRQRPASDTALRVSARPSAADHPAAEEAVARAAERYYAGLPATVESLAVSPDYALPPPGGPDGADGTGGDAAHADARVMFGTAPRERVTLTEGDWPEPAGDVIPVAVPAAAAEQLGLAVGDRLTATTRPPTDPALQLLVSGVYRPADPADAFWRLDPYEGLGERLTGFTGYGPLLADPGVFAAGLVELEQVQWQGRADFDAMTAAQTARMQTASRQAVRELSGEPLLGDEPEVTGPLPQVLADLERKLLVARGTLLISALMLGLLAIGTLTLVAGLLRAQRAEETALLKARGASGRRLIALGAAETVLLVAPAAVAAPLLAGPLGALLGRHGPVADAGLSVEPAPTTGLWLTGAALAAGCAALLLAPAVAAARGRPSWLRGRAATAPGPLRSAVDVALLVLAGIALWQLRQFSSGGVFSGTAGDLRIDPVLIVAPALALLAGTLLMLRVVPLLSRLLQRRVAAGRGLVTALAAWRVGRQPLHAARPVLLVVLALGTGMMAITLNATWRGSQADQADFQAGADLRVTMVGTGSADAGLAELPGVTKAVPAVRRSANFGDGTGDLVITDARTAAEALHYRSDLADAPPEAVFSALLPAGAAATGAPLPEGTDAVRITASLTPDEEIEIPARPDPPRLTATVRDGHGAEHSLPLGGLPSDGGERELTAPLRDRRGGMLPAPVTLTGFTLDFPLAALQPSTAMDEAATPEEYHLAAAAAAEASVTTRELAVLGAEGLTGDGGGVPLDFGDADWSGELAAEPGDPLAIPVQGGVERVTASAGLPSGRFTPGVLWTDRRHEESQAYSRLRLAPTPPELTALATDAMLAAVGSSVGDTVDVNVAGTNLRARIVGSVAALPTVRHDADRPAGALVLDIGLVNAHLRNAGNRELTPQEWWLDAEPEETAALAAALRERPDVARVVVRDEEAELLLTDPLGAGPQTALTAIAAAAAALAAIGFAVGAVGQLRHRSEEQALLFTLGAGRRQTARTTWLEQGLLIALAMALGLALGTVLARTLTPLLLLTGQGTQPVPPVLVELDGPALGLLALAVVTVPALAAAGTALRRSDPVATLRRGGE